MADKPTPAKETVILDQIDKDGKQTKVVVVHRKEL